MLNLLTKNKITRIYPMFMEMYPFSIDGVGSMIQIYEYLLNNNEFKKGGCSRAYEQ
ncbi:hypothetical protein J14TS5_60250 [Paenibacillus lautus]|nr:hypothetical protein J14TS5_60250 [Paenibacillus lautus]